MKDVAERERAEELYKYVRNRQANACIHIVEDGSCSGIMCEDCPLASLECHDYYDHEKRIDLALKWLKENKLSQYLRSYKQNEDMMGVADTLKERGDRYGEFESHAEISQSIKYCMWYTPNWGPLSNNKKEALEMIAHKIGRILNGDPNYADNWHDIAGYAMLIEMELEE